MKAFWRRYPGMLPQDMNFISGGMFGNGESAGLMDGFEEVRHGPGFSQFEETGWEDQLPTIQHQFLRNQLRPPFGFTSSRRPACGREWQSFGPGGDFGEGMPRSQSMRWAMRKEDFLDEFGTHKHPEGDFLDVYGGLGTRHFPHIFDHYQSNSFGPPRNEPFSDHPYHGSEAGRKNGAISSPLASQTGHAGRFDAYGAQPHLWRGSPRDSYERLRP